MNARRLLTIVCTAAGIAITAAGLMTRAREAPSTGLGQPEAAGQRNASHEGQAKSNRPEPILRTLHLVALRETGVKLAAEESSFASAINRARAVRGIPPVAVDMRLIFAARTHTDSMLDGRYFAHRDWSREIARYGIRGEIGQILGWHAVPDGSVQVLLRMWLASPEHRTILLDPRYHRVGVGVGVGAFEGFPHALVVTADFWSD